MKTVAFGLYLTGARALLATMLLALGGCSALQVPPAVAVYDFGPGLAVQAPGAPSLPVGAAPVLLDPVLAHAALDGTAMYYRLAYANAQQLRPYTQARWSMPPADLLAQRLRERLGATRALLQDGQTVPLGSLHLILELDEFSQVFSSPAASTGLVRVQATLGRREAGGQRWLAQRSFVAQRDAPTPDAAGGVQAQGQAVDALVAELQKWLDTTAGAH